MIQTEHTIVCDICGVYVRIPAQSSRVGDPPPDARLPNGWQVFNGSLVCFMHRIKVEDVQAAP